MAGPALFVALALAALSPVHTFILSPEVMTLGAGDHGGIPCAGCTIVLTLADQLAVIHDQPIDKVVEGLCDYLPTTLQYPCIAFFEDFGDDIIKLLAQGLNPDEVCHGIKICTDPTCNLGYDGMARRGASFYDVASRTRSEPPTTPRSEVGENPWQWLLKEINILAKKHEPILDIDGDFYSEYQDTLRGAYWRGRDCDDFSASIHAGRVGGKEAEADGNCNGIFGLDGSGNSYEETYCGGTGPMGTVILGDSAAAHFHIPPQFLHAPNITLNTYDQSVTILENEFDWPQRSWSTGHLNYSNTDVPGPVNSIYMKMFQRNRCNHRDFQNIGVNGAASGSMSEGIENSLNRNRTIDKPVLLFYALIGNDVCHPEHNLDRMTTPEQFHQNILESLQFLDKQLPAGSHVLFLGLVDGRVLWNNMHARTHPIGVTYAQVYEFLNCLEINPCWGWLNKNETIRNLTSARAAELNQVYAEIVANHTFKTFDIAYQPFPLTQAIKRWTSHGGKVWELIEPVDGFHPSQIGNSLFADVIWDDLMATHPDWLGKVNPNNNKIRAKFGDQGGY